MKIPIPKECKDYFKGKTYVSRWKEGSVLIINEDDCKNLKDKLNNLKEGKNGGFIRFIQAGMVEAEYKNGVLNILDLFLEYNKNIDDFYIKRGDFGVVLYKK